MSAGYERRVGTACPELLPFARQLLDRLPPERWTLEWYLPWWLGHAFRLRREIALDLVLSNVLGLASIRLEDDLIDGEVPREQVLAARRLSSALYEAALEPYRAHFGQDSPFWGYLSSCMREWRQASAHRGEEDLRLAGRGAPLKISAFAVCLLAGRLDVVPKLERCLHDALEAMVLYDHLGDWEADLEAGRWNAFVASVSGPARVPEAVGRHRSAVFAAMMTSNAVATHFARIEAGMIRAAGLSDTLDVPVPQLADHCRDFAARIREQGQALQAHYEVLGDRAAKLLLATSGDARP